VPGTLICRHKILLTIDAIDRRKKPRVLIPTEAHAQDSANSMDGVNGSGSVCQPSWRFPLVFYTFRRSGSILLCDLPANRPLLSNFFLSVFSLFSLLCTFAPSLFNFHFLISFLFLYFLLSSFICIFLVFMSSLFHSLSLYTSYCLHTYI
jgi:hypothetical protein